MVIDTVFPEVSSEVSPTGSPAGRKLLACMALVSTAAWNTGCMVCRTPEAPMPVVWKEPVPPHASSGVVVMLPGVLDQPDDFDEHGITAALREADPSLGIALADAHLQYYLGRDNTIVERLRDDVVGEACRRGYRRIWLMGNSLGGFGALLYASRYPDHVTGVVAVAPFTGHAWIAEEIHEAGGLARWDPGRLEAMEGDERFFREVWASLGPHRTQERRPAVFLGYGTEDDFAFANGLIADALPDERVVARPAGGHDWETWRPVFGELLARAAPMLKGSGRAIRCRGDAR